MLINIVLCCVVTRFFMDSTNNNNSVSDEEFSLLFSVEHSPKRKIRLHKVHLPQRKVLDAAFSKTHSLVVFAGSSVYTWGLEHFENVVTTNIKNYNINKYPVCVNYLRNKNIIRCAAGNGFSIFLDQNGVILSCGFGNRGCLGHGDLSNTFTPTIISSILAVNITQINCGADHVLALSDHGNLYTWGSSLYGQLGQGNVRMICSPREVFTPSKVSKAFGGEDVSVLLLKDGRILVCGSNSFGKIGFPSTCKKFSTFRILRNIEGNAVDVTLNKDSTVVLCENGFVVVMGKCGNRVYTHPQKIVLPYTNLHTVSLGNNFLAFATDKLVNMIYLNENGFSSFDSEKLSLSRTNSSKLSQCSYGSSNKSLSVDSTGSGNSKNFEITKASFIGEVFCIQNNFYVLIHGKRN